MRISNASIDCYLSISGTGYSDFQHHHWEIMPSLPIGTATNNIPTYTWTVTDIGSDSSGSWSTLLSQSVTVNNGAQARISTPNTVSLTQTIGFGNHNIQAIGSTSATNHPVSEMMWQIPQQPGQVVGELITWNANAATPSMIAYQDMGQPTYQLISTPYAVPTGQTAPLSVSGLLLAKMSLVIVPGVGGRDWTKGLATFYQVPSPSARAWWSWTINLVP